MSRARFFLTSELTADGVELLPLSENDAHHAARVLRIAAGEQLEVIAPSGDGAVVELVELSGSGLKGRVLSVLERPWYPHVTLIQGVAKGEKMDAIVRQSVEAGVESVIPVFTERSVVKLDGAKRAERGKRWRRVAEAASKQAHRPGVIEIADPIDFSGLAGLLGRYDRTIVLWEDHRTTTLMCAAEAAFALPDASVALVVGPEGGLSAAEVDELVAAGAQPATLGPSILRTETAAVVSVALAVSIARHLRESRDA